MEVTGFKSHGNQVGFYGGTEFKSHGNQVRIYLRTRKIKQTLSFKLQHIMNRTASNFNKSKLLSKTNEKVRVLKLKS